MRCSRQLLEIEVLLLGALPNARLYVVAAARLPVAATWSTTSVTDAWLVRYRVDELAAPKPGPTVTSTTAPTPTAMRPRAAMVLMRMGLQKGWKDRQPKPGADP